MVSHCQRQRRVSYLAAIIETLMIVAAAALWANVSGQIELLAAAISGAVGVGIVLGVQWQRLKHAAGTTFQPELMPAIVVSLVATRAFSAALPETLSGVTMLSLELGCAVLVGGTMGFILGRPVVRNAATTAAKVLL